MPALRDRPGNIGLLAQSYVDGLKNKHGGGRSAICIVSMALLERHRWPGNVRELQNVLQRAFLLAETDSIHIAPLSLGFYESVDDGPLGSFRAALALASFEGGYVPQALVKSGGNVSLPARRARKERRSFGRLMKKHGRYSSLFNASLRGFLPTPGSGVHARVLLLRLHGAGRVAQVMAHRLPSRARSTPS